MLNLKFIMQMLELRHNICRSKWTYNLTSKYYLESLRCLLQFSRRLLPHLRTLRSSNTERNLRGSFWILNSFRSKISILMLLHCFAFQWEPNLYTLKNINVSNKNWLLKLKQRVSMQRVNNLLLFDFDNQFWMISKNC